MVSEWQNWILCAIYYPSKLLYVNHSLLSSLLDKLHFKFKYMYVVNCVPCGGKNRLTICQVSMYLDNWALKPQNHVNLPIKVDDSINTVLLSIPDYACMSHDNFSLRTF